MSKTLTIVRHAKSSWDDPVLADFDRPLNPRGLRDAPRMGARLAKTGITPDRLVSSPANRALATAKIIAAALGLETRVIVPDERLYLASADMILRIVQEQPDEVSSLMLFGHNPGMTDLVHRLGDCPLANLPTGACVTFRVEVDRWAATGPYVDSQTGVRRRFVAGRHIAPGLTHRRDDLVETDDVTAVTEHRQA